jgi:APA family basic amino acid/polyamine antiporter
VVAAGAIAGLTSVMLVLYYAQTRILYAMSQDGLLPRAFGEVDARTRTPVKVIVICGVVMAALAALMPLEAIAELVNIGTLAAFMLVCLGVIVLRWRRPELRRPFRVPFGATLPALGALACLYLMLNLPAVTWWRFLAWMVVGLVIYFGYAHSHSRLVAGREPSNG